MEVVGGERHGRAWTFSPLRLVVAPISLTTISQLVSGHPRQFRVTAANRPVLDLVQFRGAGPEAADGGVDAGAGGESAALDHRQQRSAAINTMIERVESVAAGVRPSKKDGSSRSTTWSRTSTGNWSTGPAT